MLGFSFLQRKQNCHLYIAVVKRDC